MGAEHPKPKRKLNKIDLEIVCDKVYQYLMLHRGRKIDELAMKERAVKEKLQNQKKLYGDCLFDISSIVSLLNWINAAKIVMRNAQFIKERSMQITAAANERNSEKIGPLIKYIQSVIWASERLNLKQIKEFKSIIYEFFGPEFIKLAQQGHGVDAELANCFKFVEPTKSQVGDYLRNMLRRYGFDQFDLQKELPEAYRVPQMHESAPVDPNQNNQDQKFNYGQSHPAPGGGGGGFFDNPNNMAGQSNWGRFLGPSFSNNLNPNVNPNVNPVNPQPPLPGPNSKPQQCPNPPPPQNQQNSENSDFDKMINDLQQQSVVKEGNELVNPSMSQMNLGSKTKPDRPQKKDDFDDLIKSLQGNVIKENQEQEPKKPGMRGVPTRRNKRPKPVINEPEAFEYTQEVDEDTEDKRYEEFSLEYRIEEMRKLKV
jgi:hypothetical protein